MKRLTLLLPAVLTLSLALLANAAPDEIKTKFVINAVSEKSIEKGAPAFLIYADAESQQILEESGAAQTIVEGLEKMGYLVVEKERDAAVFVKMDFLKEPSYAIELDLKTRPTIDYSNSASTRNYAATIGGGRYSQLGNPSRSRAQNDVTTILGPNGEPITLSEREDYAAKINEGEDQKVVTRIYPLTFQVSVWSFQNSEPQQLWAVQTSYNNLADEELHPQLEDMSQAATRFFGKNLKKEKYVSRKE
ncbi:hypothetical protein [Pelagicoccus albus]|uniref:DUF4136 domain-containing protein n=1 Tax=Pelagicoccus albus TaxID=415222 RepID=A0A7X1E937_9BACT|nr:hypothetical protein [Pelagicoccus albus]MBC2606798.1 hypothetical protein [Pelagicoccus albus]